MSANSSASSPSRINPVELHSSEVFRYLVDSVADYAIFVLDTTGIISSWNPGAERLKGYRPAEIIGQHFSVFYTPPDLATDKPGYELKVAAEVGRFEDEGWRVRKDGSRFWANVVITPLRDDSGTLIGFGKITRDLTERRRAELRYRLLVESVIDYAIFSMDAHGNVTSWNQGAERLKGYTSEEIVGQHFSRFYAESDRAAGLPQKVLDTAAREGHFEGEGWRYRKDGTKFWASIVVTPLRDEEGGLYGFSKVTRDVTERKRLLDELERHTEELELRIREREETNAELEAFAYSVSHDLRAPLRAINGFAAALQEDYEGKLDEGALDYLNEITAAAGRMNALVQDLLDYGRISRIELSIERVHLASAVQAAQKQLTDVSPDVLDVEVPSDLYVAAVQPVLTQVIYNLLSNAVKFSAENPAQKVRVFTSTNHGFTRLLVEDNGIGISPEHQERIWNVFERLHVRDVYPGTGIGLAIVKRATLRMRGSYGVDSELGKGATFWIELPTATQDKSNHQSQEDIN
jgi:PAS domain S-box-containing protein